MSKVSKSADELRAIIVAEAISHPVCPRNIDVVIRPDAARGWAADVVSPNRIANADCEHWIGTIEQRLRREYDLQPILPGQQSSHYRKANAGDDGYSSESA